MTDRELLELAAKAAEIKIEWLEDICYIPDDDPEIDPIWRLLNGWRPLEDDGDAFRLSVKLNLKTVFHPALNQAIVKRYFGLNGDAEWVENVENHKGDPCAATRRAIVRAAAEIGKAMP